MQNELRKNPRFISTEGITASIQIEQEVLHGTILNFSSTGFAVVVNEEAGKSSHNQGCIKVAFLAPEQNCELKLSASITNKRTLESGQIRLGCHITDMHDQAKEYFTFLTGILGKQGFLKSMATKPKKVIQQGSPQESQ